MSTEDDEPETQGVENYQLRSIVQRIERLEEEKKATADDIRDVYAEAKAVGFDVKALREVIKRRKKDAAERQEHEAIVDTYMVALGMLTDTPLGQAAIRRDLGERGARAAAGKIEKAVEKLGVRAEPTEQEKAKGVAVAFEPPDGTRGSI